jgi:hypothetical protein
MCFEIGAVNVEKEEVVQTRQNTHACAAWVFEKVKR